MVKIWKTVPVAAIMQDQWSFSGVVVDAAASAVNI